MRDEHKEELAKILSMYGEFSSPVTWAQIYVEIGRLIERANKNQTNVPIYPSVPYPNPPLWTSTNTQVCAKCGTWLNNGNHFCS